MIINGEEMLSAMEKAVAERGDGWRYPDPNQCQYYYSPEEHQYDEDGDQTLLGAAFGSEEQPACLVGLALYYIDPMLSQSVWENGYNDSSIDAVNLTYGGHIVQLDDAAEAVATAGQQCQDKGGTWGEALVAAKDALVTFSDAD